MTNNDLVFDEETSCFICGCLLKESDVNITEVNTSFLSIPLPDKLGDIIGNKFVVVVSESDKICIQCYMLVNHFDELEHNLKIVKCEIVDLLEKKYNLHFDLTQENTLFKEEVNIKKDNCIYTEPNYSNNSNDDLSENRSSSDELNNSMFNKNGIDDTYTDKSGLTHFSDNDIDASNSCLEDILNESNVISESITFSTFNDSSKLKSKNENGALSNEYENIDDIINIKSEDCTINTQYNESGLKSAHKLQKEDTNLGSKIHPSSSQSDQIVIQSSSEESDNIKSVNNFVDPTSIDGKHFICTICNVTFPKLSLFTQHAQNHQPNAEKIKCTVCNVECQDHLDFFYHRKNIHDVLKSFTCALCEEDFSSNKDLKSHLLFTHGGNSFICSECGQEFKRHDRFQNHKLYSHGNQECRICGKHIPDVVKLRQHEKRHVRIESKQYICDVCNRVFKTPGGLRVHKVSHTGNYKFFCEFCGRGFMSSVILEEHKGVHTREDRYICDKCGRKFVLYSTFHLHVQWHKDPYPFPCSLCDKKFKYRSMRSIHVRRDHTGHHPYKCTYCDSKFLKASYLKRHLIFHTKEYPFNCSVCKKGFDQKKSLARHLYRVHNDKSLISSTPKKCQYKVMLRPEEFSVQI